MIKRLIQLVFLAVVVIVLSQLEYKGRPLKSYAQGIYRSPVVQFAVRWIGREVARILKTDGGQGPSTQDLEQISEEDQKKLETILKEVHP